MGEKELVKAILEGNEKAFQEFVNTYKLMVVNTCHAFIHSKEEAEDIAQDVFIQAYESLNQFRFDSKLSTWLYRMTTNKLINLCKSSHKRRLRYNLDEVCKREDPVVDELPLEEVIDKKEKLELLHKAIDELPEKQRTAIILNKYEDLSYKEVADTMKISVSAVESLIFRAKTNLEKIFLEYN